MDKAKIEIPHRIWLSIIFTLAWCSGVVFFILKTWFMVEGDFGPENHPYQFSSLQVHGFIAFLMMITYGYLLGTHVRDAWQDKPRQALGVWLVLLPGFQMISAYSLYYVAKDELREIIGYMHLGVGLILPLILITHVLHNKKINAAEIEIKLAKLKIKADESKA